MNILMALSQLEVTGAEVYATQVGNKLVERGHRLFYVSDTLSKTHSGSYFKLRFNKRSPIRRLWHIGYLVYLILRYRIQLVHAHSRASGWSCYIACQITNTPMVTTVHGRQPVHASRKKFHALGYHAFAVCENIAQQIVRDLGVPETQVSVIRNGINLSEFTPLAAVANAKPTIQIIGRLTGPKGILVKRLLEQCIDFQRFQVEIISGSTIPAELEPLKDKVSFLGYSDNIRQTLQRADLVIGAGRVAMEALLCEKPVFAVGEAKAIGLVNEDNLQAALASNFGDIADDGRTELDIDFADVAEQLKQVAPPPSEQVIEAIRREYGLEAVVEQLLKHYQSAYVYTKKREVPIIMYHRVINDFSQQGVYGTYVTEQRLEQHFKLINKLGFQTLHFSDLDEIGLEHRFNIGSKHLLITFDDGYLDNLELLLPLLEKHQIKATIYAVTGTDHNQWDAEHPSKPDLRFELMSAEQYKLIDQSPWVELGGHTLSHPRLSTLSFEQQLQEIVENKRQLEALLGRQVETFAYPYGDFDENSKQAAKQAGYKYTVATDSGPIGLHEDLQSIRRIIMFPSTDLFGLWKKTKGSYTYKKAYRSQ